MKQSRFVCQLEALLLALSLLGGSAYAATVNVFVGAPNVYPDFSTITGGVGAAVPGDVVAITDNSTYNEEVLIGKNLTLRSTTGLATVAPTTLAVLAAFAVAPPATNVAFENLNIVGAAALGIGVVTGANVTIDNCNISSNGAAGIPSVRSGIMVIDQFGPLGGDVTLNINNSTIDTNPENGIICLPNQYNATSYSVILNLSNTSVSGNSVDGIEMLQGGANTAITVANSCDIDGHAGGSGIITDIAGPVDISGGSSLDNNVYGVVVRNALGTNTGTDVTFSNSSASGNIQVGVWFQNGGGPHSLTADNNSTFNLNALNAIRLDGNAFVSLDDCHVNNNLGAIETVATAVTGSIEAVSTTLNANTSALSLQAGSVIPVTLTNCAISSNTGRTLRLEANVTTHLEDCTLSGNSAADGQMTSVTDGVLDILGGLVDNTSALGDGFVIWGSGAIVSASGTTFVRAPGAGFVFGPGLTVGDFTNCTFDRWGWAAINARGDSNVTLTNCDFNDNPADAGDVVFRNTNFGAAGNSSISVTGGSIECSILLRMGDVPPAGGHDSTVTLDGVTITHPTNCGNSIMWDGTGALNLSMDNCDVTGNGTPNVFLFERGGVPGQEQNVRLNPGVFNHCTFTDFGNCFVFDGNQSSNVDFDQCDFFATNPTSIWVRDAANTGGTDSNVTLDIVDTIFEDSSMSVFGPGATVTQDYNFIGNNAGFSAQFGGVISGGAHTIVDPAGPDYMSTVFGDPLYLVLTADSPAAALNSGNGPEVHAGAKGPIGPPPTSGVDNWSLFE